MKRIPLRARDGAVRAYALVDDADFDWLNQWPWCLGTKGYAIRREPGVGTVRMARAIVGLEKGDPRQADHVNQDKLDNQRSNLRVVTQAENRQNLSGYRSSTSRFRGVALTKSGKWRAYARISGVLHYLGEHDDEEVAAEIAAAFRAEHMPFSPEAMECRA